MSRYAIRYDSDNGSDMDVSSDDDDMVLTHAQIKPPHENLVQSLRHKIQQNDPPLIQPRVEIFLPSSNHGQPANSYANTLKRVIKIDDDSDTESVDSFKTAPDSLYEEDPLETPASNEVNLDHLQRMIVDLEEQLTATRARGDQIQRLIDEKNAKREALRIKKLEESVRQSIMKRKREAPVTEDKALSKKKKRVVDKGKQKAEPPVEQKTEQIAVMPLLPLQQRTKVSASSLAARQRYIDTVMCNSNLNQTISLPEPIPHLSRKQKKKAQIVNPTECPRQTEIKKQVLASFLEGGMTVRQMKILLVDLWHRSIEAKLNVFQEVHARELRKRVVPKFHDNDNDTVMFTLKKRGRASYTPPNKLFLPSDFYGHPERLDYNTFELREDDTWAALEFFTYLSPALVLPKRKTTSALDEDEDKNPSLETESMDEHRPTPFLFDMQSDQGRAAHHDIITSLERIRANSEIELPRQTNNRRPLRESHPRKAKDIANELTRLEQASYQAKQAAKNHKANNTISPFKSQLPLGPTISPLAIMSPPPFNTLAGTMPLPFNTMSQSMNFMPQPMNFMAPPVSFMGNAPHSPVRNTPARNTPQTTRPAATQHNPTAPSNNVLRQPANAPTQHNDVPTQHNNTTPSNNAPKQAAHASTQHSNAPAQHNNAARQPTSAPAQHNNAPRQSTNPPKQPTHAPKQPNRASEKPIQIIADSTSPTPQPVETKNIASSSTSHSFRPYRSVVSSLGVKSTVKELEQQSKSKVLEEAIKPVSHTISDHPETANISHVAEKRSELCNAESSGGVCRVKNCPFLHFKDYNTMQ
ncbi:hypothetical protein EDC96DRAFT_528556 [Choanephora cucurbitarum]|nr:hypothetical protein EDC96DRAFT_528556 [Choanephora cucurbitarum]